MNNRTDTTPLVTRVALLIVLAITVAEIGMLRYGWSSSVEPAYIVPTLWLFTGLFMLRVVGQVLVAIRPQQWLPPMEAVESCALSDPSTDPTGVHSW